jgi:hypothetical protein
MLQLGRAIDAHRCFVRRAFDAHDGDERRHLVAKEEEHLDRLEQKIRDRDPADVSKIERRLRGVAELRGAIGQ